MMNTPKNIFRAGVAFLFLPTVALADITGLPPSLLDLKGAFRGKINKDEVQVIVEPNLNKLGTYLIVFRSKERGQIFNGELIPEIDVIALRPWGPSKTEEELEATGAPAGLLKISTGSKGATVVITPQAGSQVLTATATMDSFDPHTVIESEVKAGEYYRNSGGFSNGAKLLTVNQSDLVDANINESDIRIVGNYRLYHEVVGMGILRGIMVDANSQAQDDAKVSAVAVAVREGSKELLILGETPKAAFQQQLIVLRKR